MTRAPPKPDATDAPGGRAFFTRGFAAATVMAPASPAVLAMLVLVSRR